MANLAATACGTDLTCLVTENETFARLLWTLLALLLAWGVARIVERSLVRSAKLHARRRRLDEQGTRALVGRTKPMRLAVTIVVLAMTILAILGIWGLRTAFTGLLAGAGFLGIVIGLAASESLGNVVAGFIIFANKPFDLGDWVEIDGTHGIVDNVALGATTVLTFDNEKITIPNRLVQNSKVKNFSHARRLRTRVGVGVEFGSHLGAAMRALVEIAQAHPLVLAEPPAQAVTVGFGASSVDLEVRFWLEPVRNSVLAVRTDIIHAIHDRFRRDGIRIAFPHMQVVQGSPWRIDGDAVDSDVVTEG